MDTIINSCSQIMGLDSLSQQLLLEELAEYLVHLPNLTHIGEV